MFLFYQFAPDERTARLMVQRLRTKTREKLSEPGPLAALNAVSTALLGKVEEHRYPSVARPRKMRAGQVNRIIYEALNAEGVR